MKHYNQDDQELDQALSELGNLRRDERKKESTWDRLNNEIKKESNRLLFKYVFRKIVVIILVLLLFAVVWWNYEAIVEQLATIIVN